MKKIIIVLTYAFLVLSFSNSYAQINGVDLIFGLGITTGGTTLAKYPIVVTNEFGSHSSTAKIKSGDSRIFFLGGNFSIPEFPVGLQLTWNYHLAWANYVEGLESDFERYSVDVHPYFRFNRFRFGLGLSYYYSVVFVENAVGGGINLQGEYKMDSSQGYFFEMDYEWNSIIFFTSLSVGIRFTLLEYKPLNIDGNNVGLFFYAAIL